MPQPSANRTLYDLGRDYAERVDRRAADGMPEQAAIPAVARHVGRGVAEVRTAFAFARAVQRVGNVAGRKAERAVLAGTHPHLTPTVVGEVARLGDADLRAAMALAARGLHPLAPPPPVGLPAERAVWHNDLGRLGVAADVFDGVDRALAGPGAPVADADAAGVVAHATAARAFADALQLVAGDSGRPARRAVPPPPPRDIPDAVRRARKLTAGATEDVLRAAHIRPPSPAVRVELAAVAARIAAAAGRVVRAVARTTPAGTADPAVSTEPAGPDDRGGTYVVVLRAAEPRVVQLGRLGTCWLPAGHLLYVGSAFGGGGVRARTNRHVGGTGPALWNVDHLRGVARPVAVWWTHHPGRVECTWATAAAALPGACCPAPRAGANDCKRCPAHLIHTAAEPDCRAFARRLVAVGSGGYTIFRQVVCSG